MQDAEHRGRVRKTIAVNSILFILGFSVVFIALGASATAFGQFLHDKIILIGRIAGVIVVIFGIHMTGLIRIPFLNYEKRFQAEGRKLGLLGAFIIGLAFAFGWTPCIGPILAGILTIASQQDTVGKGIILLTAYSLGLGIPFFLTGISISAFYNFFNKFKRHLHTVEIIGGILLIIVGILIATNSLTIISGYLSRWFPILNELG